MVRRPTRHRRPGAAGDADRTGRTQEWRAPRDVAPIPPCRSATDPRGAGATFAGIACLLAGCMILPMAAIAKRQAVVAAVPRTAALYDAIGLPVNLRGLAIAGVKTTALGDQGHGLEVAGTIRNLETTRTRVPKMTFEIRDAKGTILSHWSETAPKPLLGADETVAFLTQTADLPDGSKEVVVRFETATPVAPRAIPLLGKARPPG